MRESKLSLFLMNKEGLVRYSGGDGSQLPNRIKGLKLYDRGVFWEVLFGVFL